MSDHLGVNILALLMGIGSIFYFWAGTPSSIIIGIVQLLLAIGLYIENGIAWIIVFLEYVLYALIGLLGIVLSSALTAILELLGLAALGALLGVFLVGASLAVVIIAGIIAAYLWSVRDGFMGGGEPGK